MKGSNGGQKTGESGKVGEAGVERSEAERSEIGRSGELRARVD